MQSIVSESDVIKLLTTRINSLRSELIRTEAALNAIRDTQTVKTKLEIKLNKKTVTSSSKSSKRIIVPPQVYDSNYVWDEKILYVLKDQQAFKEDIVREISTLEPNINSKKILNVVSVKLSQLLKQGTIQGVKVGRKYRYKIAS